MGFIWRQRNVFEFTSPSLPGKYHILEGLENTTSRTESRESVHRNRNSNKITHSFAICLYLFVSLFLLFIVRSILES